MLQQRRYYLMPILSAQLFFPLGMNPGTPVSTTGLNLTRVLIPSLIQQCHPFVMNHIAAGIPWVLVVPRLEGKGGVDEIVP